jgi:predicted nucleic acid-binding protein
VSLKVVDASALGAAVFEEPEAEVVRRRMAGSDVVAPSLLWFEMASVCLKKLRIYASERQMVLDAYHYFLKMTILPKPVDHRTIPILAEELGLTGYDACYVWLARSLDAELVTLDQRLARAARKAARR